MGLSQRPLVKIIMIELKLLSLNVHVGIQRKVSPVSSECTDASMSLVPVYSTSSNTRKAELFFTCQAVEAGNGCINCQPLSCHSPANQENGDAKALYSETR